MIYFSGFFLQSIWFDMPSEVLVDIFMQLPPNDLGRLGLVCHHFKDVSGTAPVYFFFFFLLVINYLCTAAEDNWVWRQICKERFPFVQVSRYGNSWKRCYASRHRMQSGWEGGRPGDFKMTPLRAHKGYVSAFDYYRNNVVSGSADKTLQVCGMGEWNAWNVRGMLTCRDLDQIWNVAQPKPLHALHGHNGVVEVVKFNEIRIVSGAADNTVRCLLLSFLFSQILHK
jgi:hypothetical protein